VENNSPEINSEPRGLLKENLAVQLREAILAGRILPGEKIIVEQKLPLHDLEAALAEMQDAVQQNDLRKVVDRVHIVVRFHPDPDSSQEPGCQSVGTPAAKSSQNCRCNP
jgi:hypothetical protein